MNAEPSRRNFLRQLFQAAWGVPLVALAAGRWFSGCLGKDDSGTAAPASCAQSGITIASNHGHVLTILKSEVSAAAAKTYSIVGTATHDHAVDLTAGDFATLAAGGTVSVTSSSSGHTHTISITCV